MTRWIALMSLLAACSGGSTEKPKPEPEVVVEPVPETPEITPEDLKNSAENTALVPSPIETQRALEAAGIDTQLATLIPAHDFDLDNGDLEQAAVRSGVYLADMMLTVKSAEKDELIKRLEAVRKGMNQLKGGSDIDAILVDYQESLKTDAIGRDELLKEFDELSGAVIPELEFNGQERVVPLIEAGSWLEGANLMARAVKQKGKPDAADGLLKQPQVVDYFLKYVKEEGAEKAPVQVAEKLEESLNTLKGLAEKKEPLTEADIDSVIKVTSDVLALL
ncbi:MAG: hypothetical protein H6737_04015 [Alphaproteobacteria bacterium]|nr:hypothetical protein [Alphaproteobacteria bacterium]